jgi:hypothetical protein
MNQQDQASQPAGMAGCEERADPTPEAGTDEGHRTYASKEVQVVDRGPDVVDDASKGQILLTAFACSVSPEIEAQRSDAHVRQAFGKAGEETAFFSGDAPAVDENRSLSCSRGKHERSAQAKPIEAGELGLGNVHVQHIRFRGGRKLTGPRQAFCARGGRGQMDTLAGSPPGGLRQRPLDIADPSCDPWPGHLGKAQA